MIDTDDDDDLIVMASIIPVMSPKMNLLLKFLNLMKVSEWVYGSYVDDCNDDEINKQYRLW
jgi:hypothetical protein